MRPPPPAIFAFSRKAREAGKLSRRRQTCVFRIGAEKPKIWWIVGNGCRERLPAAVSRRRLGGKPAYAAGGGPPACGIGMSWDRSGRRLLGQRRTCPTRVAVLEAECGKHHDREQHDPML